MAARHGRDDPAHVGVGEELGEEGALVRLALVIGAVVQHADARGDQKGQRHDGRQRDPVGQAGKEAVKVVPAALFLAYDRDHDVVNDCVDQHRDQRQQRVADGQALLAHEKAEGNDREDRADPVQEKARAREDQHEALGRREDEQRDQKGQRHGGHAHVDQIHDPARHVVVVRAQPVERIGDDHRHRGRAEDVGVDREHAEGPQAHVVEVLVREGREIHRHADAHADHDDGRAEKGQLALPLGDLHRSVHNKKTPFEASARRADGDALLRPYSTTARRCRARARDALRRFQYPTTTPSTMKPSTSRKLTRNSGALLRIQVKYSTSIIDSEISSTGEVGKITFV